MLAVQGWNRRNFTFFVLQLRAKICYVQGANISNRKVVVLQNRSYTGKSKFF